MKSFTQNSGNGIGPQLHVRPDEMSQAACPDPSAKPKRGRKTKLAAFGLSPSIISRGDPDYAVCLDQANKYRKTRMKELTQLHGYISAGVGALLSSASLALAASRFLYQRAATDGDAATLKMASKLASDGRQCELAAWEVAAREGQLKRRHDASGAATPWLIQESTQSTRGRKSNAERQLAEVQFDAPPFVEGVEFGSEAPDE